MTSFHLQSESAVKINEMYEPSELSLSEIRKFMLENGCKVTNHDLVKYFKRFLTDPVTQGEARKQFKTYVNILATIRNENNQKYLILRKKYLTECPSEDSFSAEQSSCSSNPSTPLSPGAMSLNSESDFGGGGSPFRQPPPYKPPPEVSTSPAMVKVPVLETETKLNYKDCISEFQAAMFKIDPGRNPISSASEIGDPPDVPGLPSAPPRKRSSAERSMSRESSVDENKENVAAVKVDNSETVAVIGDMVVKEPENSISVKEATKRFNRLASEEEAKVCSPSPKKKPEKPITEDKVTAEVTLAHPKGKEWIVSAAKASYQDLAKLASDYPELVKLQTALHWAAKHGNEDVVKLIAGTYKADVNSRTNGGYTPLHLAMQFGKENIFDLLVNVYKANRDLTDWSGNKPLDYSQQKTSVSASTYSSEYELLRPSKANQLLAPYANGGSQNRVTIAAGGLSLTRRKRDSRKNGQNGNTKSNEFTTLDNTIRAQSMLLTGDIISAQEKCEVFLASERGRPPSNDSGGDGDVLNEAKNEHLLTAVTKKETKKQKLGSGGGGGGARQKRNQSFLTKKKLKLKTAASGMETNDDTYC